MGIKTYKPVVRILAYSLVAGGLMYLATLFFPRRYMSYQTLYFPLSQQSSLGSVLSAAGAGPDSSLPSSLGGAFSIPIVASGAQAATGIVTSRTAAMSIVKSLDLGNLWNKSNDEAVADLLESLVVRQDKNSMLRIEVYASSPKLANEINKALYDHLLSRAGELSVNVGSRVRKSIETALQENSERLAAKRVKLEDIIARGSLGRYSDASSAFIAVRKAYDDAVVQAAIAKGRLEAAKAGVGAVLNRADGSTALGASSAGSGGGGISDEGLKTLSDELQKRRLALLDAASEFQPDTPEYRNAKRELDNAQRVIRQSVEEQRNALKKGLNPALIQAQAELAGLERSVVAAGKLVRDYQNKVADTPKTEESFGEYQALIDVRTMLTKELERAKLNESSDPSRFEVLDPPSSDTKPESPRPLLLSAIAFVAVAAVMIAFEAALRQRRA